LSILNHFVSIILVSLVNSRCLFGLWAKYTWQLCSKSSMQLTIPKVDKVLNARLHL
jgi:hypothetical protein